MSDAHSTNKLKNYKFRELKVYASTEWLADNKKKYRQVFDRHDTSYIYAELSFFNKLFDEDDWDVQIGLKCFSTNNKNEPLCDLNFNRTVSRYDNKMFIREGWGNKKPGSFWKKGTYFWEAWIDDEKVATKFFYVEDSGKPIQKDDNPYIDITSIKLYEGPFDDVNADDRVYYKAFAEEDTRYIYVEMEMQNLNPSPSWHLEVFTKFYNNSRELKGQVVRLQKVVKEDDIVRITAGWGSNGKGSWRNDSYTAEIVFMDRLLAVIPFEVTEEFEEGNCAIWLPHKENALQLSEPDDINMTFEELMGQLDEMIGLDEIKQKVRDHAKYLQFLQLRKDKGFEDSEEINVHAVFIGNPGTGKTTVAKMMGKLYKKMGLLSKGHVEEVDRVDLVGEYIGQTAPKVKEVIERARGGVLFIDEAYALARVKDDSKDFGREVIEILVKEMSNGPGDLAVIVAGYPKEMKYFLDSNPGLKSRFKHQFEFRDYLPHELSQIADYFARQLNVTIDLDAKKALDEIIINEFRNRDRSFGNARFVFDLIEKAKINLGLRVMNMQDPEALENEVLERILLEDVLKISLPQAIKLPNLPIDEKLLEQALADLDSLIGMKKIKEEIREMVQLVRYYKNNEKNVLNTFSLHTVLIGNPGTGKTTIARIITKLYKALGLLERGQIVETDRQGLVAGYVGQTAIKTAEKIDEAVGGVLFIDEAYALTAKGIGAHGDFGDEAIQTLLKRMEDGRGAFFVFVAGYPENMEAFLKANPGLRSRFDKVLRFEDYSPEELFDIAISMLAEKDLKFDKAAAKYMQDYLIYIHQFRDKYFGNARTVRKLIGEILKHQNLRLAELNQSELDSTDQHLITIADVEAFKTDKSDWVFERKSIGFGK